MNPPAIHVLIALRLDAITRYRERLANEGQIVPRFVASITEVWEALNDAAQRTDALVIDNELGGVFEVIKELRKTYPRLWIVLVDEEADFAMPGRADAASTEPFKENDLVKKIKRLAEERRLETIHKDALAPVRAFARAMAKAGRETPRPQVAVETVQQLGYAFAAYYVQAATTPPSLTLTAQAGEDRFRTVAPSRPLVGSLPGWVAEHGQGRISQAGEPLEQVSYPLSERGLTGPSICVPVGITLRFGVLVACKPVGATVQPDDVNALELIAQQLAAALAKEVRGP